MYLNEFNITLRHVEPKVWRRVAVPETVSLMTFHRIIQASFGWRDYHDFSFYSTDQKFEVVMCKEDLEYPAEGVERRISTEVTLAQFLAHPLVGKKALYVYDFGDDWQHDIELVRRRRVKSEDFDFLILDGSGRCPPEDVGGYDGYRRFKAVLAGKEKPEPGVDLGMWYGLRKGEVYDPDYFSLYDTQTRLWKLQHYQTDPVCW